MKNTPIHEHDCKHCIYIGSSYKRDYYLCISKEHPSLSTLVARYGKDGNYNSGLEFCWSNIYLNKALKLADKQGLLTNKELRKHILNQQTSYLAYLEKNPEYAKGIARRWKKHTRYLIK